MLGKIILTSIMLLMSIEVALCSYSVNMPETYWKWRGNFNINYKGKDIKDFEDDHDNMQKELYDIKNSIKSVILPPIDKVRNDLNNELVSLEDSIAKMQKELEALPSKVLKDKNDVKEEKEHIDEKMELGNEDKSIYLIEFDDDENEVDPKVTIWEGIKKLEEKKKEVESKLNNLEQVFQSKDFIDKEKKINKFLNKKNYAIATISIIGERGEIFNLPVKNNNSKRIVFVSGFGDAITLKKDFEKNIKEGENHSFEIETFNKEFSIDCMSRLGRLFEREEGINRISSLAEEMKKLSAIAKIRSKHYDKYMQTQKYLQNNMEGYKKYLTFEDDIKPKEIRGFIDSQLTQHIGALNKLARKVPEAKERIIKATKCYLHSEQLIFLWFFSNVDNIVGGVEYLVKSEEKKKTEDRVLPKSIVLNIFTDFDMCNRCAHTLSLESEIAKSRDPKSVDENLICGFFEKMNYLLFKKLEITLDCLALVSSCKPTEELELRRFQCGHDGGMERFNAGIYFDPARNKFVPNVAFRLKPHTVEIRGGEESLEHCYVPIKKQRTT